MPKEYLECVKSESKKHSRKKAQKICAISYYKRHGVSVTEAHKRLHKSLGEIYMEKFITLARSKETLIREATRIARNTGLDKDDFVVLPIVDDVRNHPVMKSLEPDIVDKAYKFMLVRKSIGGRDFVVLTTEGKIKLDFGVLPENAEAREANTADRHDTAEDTVNVTVNKSVAADEKKDEKEDEKEDKKDSAEKDKSEDEKDEELKSVAKEEAVSKDDEFVESTPENPNLGTVTKAKQLLEKVSSGNELDDTEVDTLKSILELIVAAKSLLNEDVEVTKSVASTVVVNEDDTKFLTEVLTKSINNLPLSEIERATLVAVTADAKTMLGTNSSRQARDAIYDVIKSLAEGKEVTTTEKKLYENAVQVARTAKADITKSLVSSVQKIATTEDETPEALYKSLTGTEPPNGLFAFTNKSDANKFRELLRVKEIVGKSGIVVKSVGVRERGKLSNQYMFVAILSDN